MPARSMMYRLSVVLAIALPASGRSSIAADLPPIKRAVVLQHSKIVYARYSDWVTEAKKMQTAVQQFVAAPDDALLEAAKKAWTAARRPYLQSEAYRFYAGPIDDPDGPEPML